MYVCRFRLDNEDLKDYKLRLMVNKHEYGLNWNEIANLLNAETGMKYDESTYRKWYNAYEKDKMNEQFTEITNYPNVEIAEIVQDDMNEFDVRKIELLKEKRKIQDEKNELNKWIREQSRMDLFEEKILQAIVQRNKQIQIPKLKINNSNQEQAMILSIADQHYGAEFEVKGMLNETLNRYSPEIFNRRMWDVLDETVSYAEKNNFKKVYIFDLDDSIEGMLHISQLMTLRYGVTDSIVNYADFMETWLNELSKYLTIEYSRVKGNHNDFRLLTGKKGDFPHENSSKIITHIIAKGLRDNPNILVEYHNNIGCIYKNIMGFDVLVSHGQDERGNLEQSFKDYMLTYKINIDYFYTGHLHSSMLKEIGVNKEFIQTPSLMGVNDFSLGIKKTSNAGAKITILSKHQGRTDEHNIILK